MRSAGNRRATTRALRCSAPALLLAIAGGAHAQVGFFPLSDLPGGANSSQGFDISADGRVVVGLGSAADGVRATQWMDGGAGVSLGNLPGGFGTVANGVNASGSVIVGYGFTQMGLGAFRWSETDGLTELSDLPGGAVSSYATRVSDDGLVIVGDSMGATGQEAAIWTSDGAVRGLGDFPGGAALSTALDVSADGAVVVGYGFSTNGYEAFRWTEADGLVALGDLPGGSYMAQGVGVSGGGDFVVGRSLSGFGQEAFLWSADAGMIALGDLPGGQYSSIANAVTDDGMMVVGRGSTVIGNEAVVWTPSTGMVRLADFLANEWSIDVAGWRLIDATSMSADGSVIAGYGVAPGGSQQAWMARLFEPAPPCPEDAFVSLWPPDQTMRTIDVGAIAGVEGAITILGVTSDEPVNELADGYTLLDARIEDGVIRVRAERSMRGDGRVYQIRYAVDGEACEASVFVRVDLDEGVEAVDSGQSYDPSQKAMAADINGDGFVESADLGVMLGEWRACGAPPNGNGPDSDLNGDDRVDARDLLQLLRSWNPRGFKHAPARRVGHWRR
jgi:probable HAF family extracellular repeat protein